MNTPMTLEAFRAEFQRLCTAHELDCWMYINVTFSGYRSMAVGTYYTRAEFSDSFDCDGTPEQVLARLQEFLLSQGTPEWRREVAGAMGVL